MFFNLKNTFGKLPIFVAADKFSYKRMYISPYVILSEKERSKAESDNVNCLRGDISWVANFVNEKIQQGLILYDNDGNVIDDFSKRIKLYMHVSDYECHIEYPGREEFGTVCTLGHICVEFESTNSKDVNMIISEAIVESLILQIYIFLQMAGVYNRAFKAKNNKDGFKDLYKLVFDKKMIQQLIDKFNDNRSEVAFDKQPSLYADLKEFDMSEYVETCIEKNGFDKVIIDFEIIRKLNLVNYDLYSSKDLEYVENTFDELDKINSHTINNKKFKRKVSDVKFDPISFVNSIVQSEEY